MINSDEHGALARCEERAKAADSDSAVHRAATSCGRHRLNRTTRKNSEVM
jgi:hypothetical protein